MSSPVKIAKYDPQWPWLFEMERHLILRATGHIIVRIAHMGSTAVPSLGAEPTIDIMVAINRLNDSDKCIDPLQRIGYEYQPEHETSTPQRRFFRKGEPPREQHYHLHMVELKSDFWKRHLLFRDYLRTHPETAQKYYELKKRLADKHALDRDSYAEAKTPFIESIVAKAITET